VPLSRLGLIVHGGKASAVNTAQHVREWGARCAVDVVDIDVWGEELPRRQPRDEVEHAGALDLVVTVGGDGTFLRGARIAAVTDAPVLGVDLGRVGFLTEVPAERVDDALDAVHAGRALVEDRMTLGMRASRPLEIPEAMEALLRYGRGPMLPPPETRSNDSDGVDWGVSLDVMALNDVVFEKLSRDHMATVGVYVRNRLFAAYSADAFVVATPTGSTAYSFAAGGPLLSPRLDALIFTPVAPHMVFDRSVIAAADEAFTVRVLEASNRIAVSVDGQLRGVLDPGDWITVYAHPWRARLVRLAQSDFYGRVRRRFGLADAPAAAATELPEFARPGLPSPPGMHHLDLG
jgi:NAD+ kinase